ncbi:site-specific integrase [candidate division KSB1 bacterium]|nr:MAG: site-specific integrase [candidate division KSB1 bacterium]RLF72270.1 MAG: site-specific integrase [Thermoplasmata archaeon]
MPQKKKYSSLLNNKNISRWYHNISRGSKTTADVYLRRLGSFCNSLNTTPSKLINMDPQTLYNLILDYITSMEKQNYTGSYIQSSIKAVKSWLSHNNIHIINKIKIKGAYDAPTIQNERVPTQDELRRIFLSADKKARAVVVLMAHSGLRPQSLGNYNGTDGLRIKDFPEMKIYEDEISFEKIPTMVIVRKELSKARFQYFTFLSEEGCSYLKDYLEERMRKGEKLHPDSPIITPKVHRKPFIRTVNIGDAARGAIRKAGFSWRPYVLRAFFDTQMMLAESKGYVMRDYRQFWMGHKGDIEHRYTLNKGMLPLSVVEDMRRAYKKAQRFLQTTAESEMDSEKVKLLFKKELLLAVGYSQEEIEEMDLSEVSEDEFQKIVKEKLEERKNNHSSQKVVTVSELERFLEEGWEFVATLPGEKVVIKRSE